MSRALTTNARFKDAPLKAQDWQEHNVAMDIRVRYLLSFMETNLERNILLSELASLTRLSNSRLRHLLKTETGLSPKQTLSNLRLSRAKVLLEETPLSIDQIALKVGWQDRSHFERRFKR